MISLKQLKIWLRYYPSTGRWKWLRRKGKAGKGRTAGTVTNRGYRCIGIDNKRYAAHRLAHFYMTGKWPSVHVDHKGLSNDDNRWSKLRPATRSQNLGNAKRHRDNKSGYKGVSYKKARNVWGAEIMVDRKRIFLGEYKTPIKAHRAYCRAAVFHRGEFARFT